MLLKKNLKKIIFCNISRLKNPKKPAKKSSPEKPKDVHKQNFKKYNRRRDYEEIEIQNQIKTPENVVCDRACETDSYSKITNNNEHNSDNASIGSNNTMPEDNIYEDINTTPADSLSIASLGSQGGGSPFSSPTSITTTNDGLYNKFSFVATESPQNEGNYDSLNFETKIRPTHQTSVAKETNVNGIQNDSASPEENIYDSADCPCHPDTQGNGYSAAVDIGAKREAIPTIDEDLYSTAENVATDKENHVLHVNTEENNEDLYATAEDITFNTEQLTPQPIKNKEQNVDKNKKNNKKKKPIRLPLFSIGRNKEEKHHKPPMQPVLENNETKINSVDPDEQCRPNSSEAHRPRSPFQSEARRFSLGTACELGIATGPNISIRDELSKNALFQKQKSTAPKWSK